MVCLVEYDRPPPSETAVPSPMMILVEALVGEHVSMMSEKKAQAYLDGVGRRLAAQAALADIIPIRRTPRATALANNHIAAAEAWRASASVFLASVRRG